MADKTIGSLPEALEIFDSSLLITEQAGQAHFFKSKLLKEYAAKGVDALVTAAQEAAAQAEDAAQAAEEAVSKIQNASAEAEAAAAAARAAESARVAAVAAKVLAEQAASSAAADAVVGVEQNLSTYVIAAQAAQAAAERARDEAQSITGGDFLSRATYDPQGKRQDIFAYVDAAIANMELPDDVGDMTAAVYDPTGQKTDIFQLIWECHDWIAEVSDVMHDADDLIWRELEDMVPNTRTINGKALSSDIVLTASDLGASGGSTFYNAIIGTTWTEDEDTGVKSQTLTLSGVTGNDNAHVEPRYTGDGTSDGYAAFVTQKNQFFNYITNGYAETVDGGITFYIFGDANTVSIPVVVEVK